MGRRSFSATILLLTGLSPFGARADDISAAPSGDPAIPPALTEPAPRSSPSLPENSFITPHSRRYQKRPPFSDQQSTDEDETVSGEEREQLRKEDRDPTRYQTLDPGTPPVPDSKSLPARSDAPVEDKASPRWNTGSGRAQFHAGGSQAQTVISGLRAEHTFWNSVTIFARAEGEIDLLRESNNFSAAGGMAWRLFRPLTLTAEGGAGGATFASWTQFGGSLSLLLEDLFETGLDTRLTVRGSGGSGILGSIDQQAALLGFSATTFGATFAQDISESFSVSFEADFGSHLEASGSDIGVVRAASGTEVRQEATHLAQAALSRRFAPLEGAFAATRWNLALGVRVGKDMRLSIEAGQMLSGLEYSEKAAWWAFSPKIETDLTPRTALQLEALWAPLISPPLNDDAIFPSDLILGRIGLRLLWP